MNDLSKTIEVDKSSLISLKAELLRKKDEAINSKKSSVFVQKKFPKIKEETKISEKPVKNKEKNEDPEESYMLKRSKEILERKSKFYEHMQSRGASNENYLVMFDKKRRDSSSDNDSIGPLPKDYESYDLEESPEAEIGPLPPIPSSSTSTSGDREVEYIDCLGRTRTILEKDLLKVKAQDKDLYESAEARKEQGQFKDNKVFSNYLNNINIGENFQQQRQDWEKQEEKNQMEDFVHYQDILFNEAREHGVGYYEFSTDQERRAKQMEELEKTRQETTDAQKKQQSLKEMRDKMLADRVKAARERVRARTGIVIEEPKNEETHEDPKDHMDKEEEKFKASKKSSVKEDQAREKARKQHVRPWDKHKRNSDSDDSEKEWTPKKEYQPVSQEVWNERNRQIRNAEFAPCYEKNEKSSTKPFYSEMHPKLQTFTRVQRSYQREEEDSSSRPKESNSYSEISYSYPEKSQPTKRPKLDPSNKEDLEKSIEAGLKFLRQQTSINSTEKQMQNKNKWTSYKE